MDPCYPFTATQWQELELQALCFKFMMSGHPIPPDLIFSINKSTSFTPQPQPKSLSEYIGIGMRWGCFEMGRKTDPEPTRCRRTDGKKWRCSKHTSGDSKYCERHMHRGKTRPTRKLAAIATGTTCTTHSNFSSVTTCDMKHVKDPNFMTILGSDSGSRFEAERQRLMKIYRQFIEESPSLTNEKRDSWLSLVI